MEIKYSIGDIVYLLTDPEQSVRMVVGMNIRPEGVMYVLVCGTHDSVHYDNEISKDRNSDIILNLN